MVIDIQTISEWECVGVPIRINSYLISVFRDALFEK